MSARTAFLPIRTEHLAVVAGEGGPQRLLADRLADPPDRAVRQRRQETVSEVAAETFLRLVGVVLQVLRFGPDDGMIVVSLDQQDGVRRAVGEVCDTQRFG